MIILAIETSCDETSLAIIENKKVVRQLTISQIDNHLEYGGVVPSLAARLHLKNVGKIFRQLFEESKFSLQEINYIAYTSEPGLLICLQIGKIIAETLALFMQIPIIPCNHLLGHAYSSIINSKENWKFPLLALIISGGHTQFWKFKDHGKFEMIGETLDDAIGECIDKASIIMGKGYPGGNEIEEMAKLGKDVYDLPNPKNDNTLDMSFSGLKSEIKRIANKEGKQLNIYNLSASLQKTLLSILTKKMKIALEKIKPKTVVIGGGVIANEAFRNGLLQKIKEFNPKIKVLIPEKNYCGDNAAMIGVLAFYKIKYNF